MKINIEKRPADKAGKQSLRLVYNLGITIGADGKKIRKRKREYLSLYLYEKPKNTSERQHNKDAMRIAEAIKAKRLFESESAAHGLSDQTKLSASFFDYYDRLAQTKTNGSKSNYLIWTSACNHLRSYHKTPELTFAEITSDFLEGFKNHLKTNTFTKSLTRLSNNTQSLYFSKIRAALNQAYKDGIIRDNPVTKVASVKFTQSKREYLTLEELKELAKAECRKDVLRRAFLFSCLTGLRWSDIQKLVWREVQKYGEGYRIIFKQKKTGSLQYLDLSPQAYELMGDLDVSSQRVFKGLKYSSWHNVSLMQWACRAGIKKHITFHSARHTFAVLQLAQGTDIYTLSKLLGHSELKTTQIYADIIEKTRKEAMNVIPNIFE